MPYPTSSAELTSRRSRLSRLLLVAALLMPSAKLAAQWRLESWFGDAWSLPTSVTFSQVDEPAIEATGHWSTRPFEPTWYYAGRIAKWSGNAAWALEYIHHKIYMDNPPSAVQYFRITNGINFGLIERLWRSEGWEYGVGAGPVLAVPVSSVRGLTYNNAHGVFHSQYELAGAGLTANVARRIRLLPWVYVSLSLKATTTYLHLHINDGHASLFNVALHADYGLSLQAGR